MSFKRKILAFSMLLIVAAPLFSFIYFFYTEKQARHQMEEKLEKAALQQVVLPLSDLHWIEDGKEALVNGKYFDVESFVLSTDHIVLTGLFDSKEDKLHSQLKKIFQVEEEPSLFGNMAVFMFFPVYFESGSVQSPVHWQTVSNRYLGYTEKIPSSPVADITHPPGA